MPISWPDPCSSIHRSLIPLSALLLVSAYPVAGAQGQAANQVLPPVEGRVWSDDGAPVSGALVRLAPAGDSIWLRITETDDLGFFSLDPVPAGSYRLVLQQLGFAQWEDQVAVRPGESIELEIILESQALVIDGISVEGERSRERARFEESAGLTVQELDREELKMIPGLAEADPIRAIEVLPGVTTVSDFSAAFNVRGGSADQNLILLDDVPVFSPFHLGGFFSVFNADMVGRAELRSGGFPAEYGGRVSSVLSVGTDVGDGETGFEGGVSLLASRLAVNGSLPEGMTSGMGLANAKYRVSGRRSYFDILFRPVATVPYHLNDLQAAFEGWTHGGNRFMISAYSGRDVLDLGKLDPDDVPLSLRWSWGNDIVGGKWTNPMRGGGAFDLRASFSRFGADLGFAEFADTKFITKIKQATVGADLELRPTPRLQWKSGLSADRYGYENSFETGGTAFADWRGKGTQLSLYSQANWVPTDEWLVEAGVRLDQWRPDPGTGEWTMSPRIAGKRFFREKEMALRFSAGRYSQFIHSVRDEELPIGLDVWVLTGEQAPRVQSDQVQFGFESYLGDEGDWFGSVEAYYRTFDGVITQNFAEDPNDPTDDLLAGDGWSYGLDFFLRKNRGNTTGWISISLLKTERTFPDTRVVVEPIPDLSFPPVYDRRLDVDLVLQRPLGWGVTGGLRWNFGTGIPYTRPLGTYSFYRARLVDDGRLEEDPDFGDGVLLGPRNGARYPARHRLDMSFRKPMEKSWGQLTPYVDIINLYNQKNVLFYFYDYGDDPALRRGISMIPLLPTIGIEVKF